MVPDIEPKIHGMGKCQQFTELAIRSVIKSAQGHLDPLLKVSLQEGLPIRVRAINYQWLHFLPSNLPIPANGFNDKVCPPLHSLTKAASFPL
jgi:hypothetical protein